MATDTERRTARVRSSELRPHGALHKRELAPGMMGGGFSLDPAAFADALENSQDCISVVDLQGHVLYMNLPGIWQMGIEDPARRIVDWPQLWSSDCADLAKDSIEMARCGRCSRFTTRRPTIAGAVKWWDVAASPVFDRCGDPAQMLCISRDITDLKKAESSVRDTLAGRDMMLLEANHRIKNSLAGVAGLLSLQAHRSNDERVRACLLAAHSRVMVVAQIHRRLYETDAQDRIDIGDYLAEVARGTIATLSAEDRVVLQTLCERGIRLPADQALCLARIVAELITNCVKHAFGAEVGKVRMQFKSHAGKLLLRVDDDGRGLPTQLHSTSANGLGMRIVTELIHQLHGMLQIERGKPGAHFIVMLPGDTATEDDSRSTSA